MSRHRWVVILVIFFLASTIFMVGFLKEPFKVQRLFITIFSKDAILARYDRNGRVNGKYLAYTDGNLFFECNFIHGLKEGRPIKYYDNGNIDQESFFVNDIANGPERKYYKNGILNYSGYWKNGKRYGSLVFYKSKGELDSYGFCDITGRTFYVYHTDDPNDSLRTWQLISPMVYVTDIKGATVLITNNIKLVGVRDLNFTVATPPGSKPTFSIIINNIPVSNYKISNNTLTIENIFQKKGKYKIEFSGKILRNNYKISKSPTLEYNVIIV